MRIDESKTMQEIHEIQEQIYEEMKDLSPDERARRINESALEYVKKYNLKVKFLDKH
jgi:hypothetical protein